MVSLFCICIGIFLHCLFICISGLILYLVVGLTMAFFFSLGDKKLFWSLHNKSNGLYWLDEENADVCGKQFLDIASHYNALYSNRIEGMNTKWGSCAVYALHQRDPIFTPLFTSFILNPREIEIMFYHSSSLQRSSFVSAGHTNCTIDFLNGKAREELTFFFNSWKWI